MNEQKVYFQLVPQPMVSEEWTENGKKYLLFDFTSRKSHIFSKSTGIDGKN